MKRSNLTLGIRKLDLLMCLAIGVLSFLAIDLFHTRDDIAKTVGLLHSIVAREATYQPVISPFVWRFAKYIVFYVFAGAVVAFAIAVLAALLQRPTLSAESQRRRFWWTFVAIYAGFILYIHLRMMTLHPALFTNSYRLAWFAGDPVWAYVVSIIGKIVPLVFIYVLVRKHRQSIVPLILARWQILVLVLVAFGASGAIYALRKVQISSAPLANSGPNVIIISLDSVRPDHISWKGLRNPYKRETTPNIDRFLGDAVWFDQAYVPNARTYPSWISTLTGCWPPTHGVRFDLAPEDSLLPRAQTLAHALKEREYRTAFFMDNTTFAWMPPDVGFDEIVQPPPNAVDFAVTYVQPAAILYYYFLNNRLGFHFDPSLRLNAAYRTIYKPQYMEKEISNFLWRMRSETKFFMAVHLVCIHVPFCVSYPYSTYFRPGFGPVLNRFGYRPLLEQIVLKKEAKEEFSDEERWQIYTQEINLYDALTRSSDSSFGAIIDSIRKAGLYDNSYIVFLSDHGENLPEPGLRYLYASSTHGFFMWGDGDTHIPLAIKFPDNRHAGRRVERLVRSIDIAPTLLDSLGLPAMKTDGVSRMPDIEGKSDDRERWTYAETGESAPMFFVADHLAYEFDDYFQAHEIDPPSLRIHKKKKYMPNLIMSKDRMVRTEQWKLISYPIVTSSTLSFRTELFDVIADRNNCEDVSSSHPAVVQELHAKLWPFIEQDLKEFGSGSLRSVERPGRYVSRDRDDPKNPSPNPVHEQVSH